MMLHRAELRESGNTWKIGIHEGNARESIRREIRLLYPPGSSRLADNIERTQLKRAGPSLGLACADVRHVSQTKRRRRASAASIPSRRLAAVPRQPSADTESVYTTEDFARQLGRS